MADLEKKTKSWNNEYVTSNMTKKAVVAKKFGELSSFIEKFMN